MMTQLMTEAIQLPADEGSLSDSWPKTDYMGRGGGSGIRIHDISKFG
jgi:hypothetical protein